MTNNSLLPSVLYNGIKEAVNYYEDTKMTFIAQYNQNQIVSLDYTPELWLDLKKEYDSKANTLVCLECGEPMIPKTRYVYDTHFFAHKPLENGELRECSFAEHNSSFIHRYIQSEIYRLAKINGYETTMETRLLEGKRIADVVVNNIIMEVQSIRATEVSLSERTEDYRNTGKRTVWFFFLPKRPNRSDKAKLGKLLETLLAFEIGTGWYENHSGNFEHFGVWCSRNASELWSLNNLLPKIVANELSLNTKMLGKHTPDR